MSHRVRYGVQIEFTIDNVLEGGPSKATIRKTLRGLLHQLQSMAQAGQADPAWRTLTDPGIKYLHEATTTQEQPK